MIVTGHFHVEVAGVMVTGDFQTKVTQDGFVMATGDFSCDSHRRFPKMSQETSSVIDTGNFPCASHSCIITGGLEMKIIIRLPKVS